MMNKLITKLSRLVDESLEIIDKPESAYLKKIPKSLQGNDIQEIHGTQPHRGTYYIFYYGLETDSLLFLYLKTIVNIELVLGIPSTDELHDLQKQNYPIGKRILICEDIINASINNSYEQDNITPVIIAYDPIKAYLHYSHHLDKNSNEINFSGYCESITEFIEKLSHFDIIKLENYIDNEEMLIDRICNTFNLRRHNNKNKHNKNLIPLSYSSDNVEKIDESVSYSTLCKKIGYENKYGFIFLQNKTQLISEQVNELITQSKHHPAFDVLQAEIEQLSHELTTLAKSVDRPISYSQLGQDLWVLKQHRFKRGGFFVDFGATNGILLSNSYLLEKYYAWTGLCAEPNPIFFAELKRNRQCTISNTCIGGKTGEKVEFLFAGVLGGMMQHINNDHLASTRKNYASNRQSISQLETISLHDFLRQHNAPQKIDYLSIDTEGSELEILQAFPFEQWDITVLTIEHNFVEPERTKVRDLMHKNGYSVEEHDWDDWYWK